TRSIYSLCVLQLAEISKKLRIRVVPLFFFSHSPSATFIAVWFNPHIFYIYIRARARRLSPLCLRRVAEIWKKFRIRLVPLFFFSHSPSATFIAVWFNPHIFYIRSEERRGGHSSLCLWPLA